jgi:DNA-binding response OmpR family regulator
MATIEGKKRVLLLLKRLSRVHAIAERCSDALHKSLYQLNEPGLSETALANLMGSRLENPSELFSKPIVDPTAMTITWHGRTCKLGHSIKFRLFDRLARRPGQYLTLDRLVRDVWDGQIVSDDAIRSAIRHLKLRLKRGGMKGLAAAIRCERRHYYLDPDSLE